ncbi:FAD-dependent oxidoreductase [Solwaraspora sp. WMMD406]|uniref:FAD-dependent oxidoreductase n=1 Tax=Solwaraspora sp. WMMD406 TaxID=3016095 RepID=UPI0024180529|nr:FAD-dependent oxidoreductase [Solwaraspora sp. WMMD406]MDG4765677.1 FAD-dependent oxidoreductase [Solwaraspora sp. WMMD406]
MFDVVVVGTGIIGLTSATRIRQQGLRVLLVGADPPERTVSAIAAAVWYPTRTEGTTAVLDWARRTFDEFAEQARQAVPGVVMRPTRMLLRSTVDVPPWWGAAVPDLRYYPIAEPGSAGSGPADGGPAGRPDAVVAEWRCTMPTVEMRPYLRWLAERFRAAGGVTSRRGLATLAQAAETAPVVVNATGLAAGRLADDPAVHPVRGQVVLMANPGIVTSVRDERHPDGPTYVHPRGRDVVLGGTFEPYADSLLPDPAVARAIVARCTAMVPELAGARVLDHLVGLRPARHGGVRLAVDPAPPRGVARLIHCYGHGGAGMTLSWGCADEVAALATAC